MYFNNLPSEIVYLRLYHGIDISRPLRQLAKGGRCWGRKLTELRSSSQVEWFLTTQSRVPDPAGSHATIWNTCWISMWLFGGGTCGGLWSFPLRWHEIPDGTNFVKGVQQKTEKHLLINMTRQKLQDLRKKGTSDRSVSHRGPDCCWLSSC